MFRPRGVTISLAVKILYKKSCVRRDSSVGTSTRYGLDGPGIDFRWGVRFSAPVQTGPGAHPSSYAMGTWSFPGVKRPERDVDHPPPSRAEVKERLELYLYSSSHHSWPVLSWTLFCKKKNVVFYGYDLIPFSIVQHTTRCIILYSACYLYCCCLLQRGVVRLLVIGDRTVTDAPICEMEGTLHKYLSEMMIYCTSLWGRGLIWYYEWAVHYIWHWWGSGKCWRSQLFIASGHTRYCELVRGPHVEK